MAASRLSTSSRPLRKSKTISDSSGAMHSKSSGTGFERGRTNRPDLLRLMSQISPGAKEAHVRTWLRLRGRILQTLRRVKLSLKFGGFMFLHVVASNAFLYV